VRNLAVEQHAWWHPGRKSAPGYLEQSRQLSAARADNPWLAAGSQTVQQAQRDFARAMAAFFAGTHGRPSWRKAGRDGGFRVTGQRGRGWDVRRLNRHWGEAWVPKAGWVRFRWSRDVPADVRSFQVAFRCVACGYAGNADVNAARNIAAGNAVKARGGDRDTGPVNREPQLLAP
jgi:putative transposase